ncbi:MAG: substrate-binding domain-containing protein [Dictyoglomaceae bacterium]
MNLRKNKIIFLLFLLLITPLFSFSSLRLATTTSVKDSGLLDEVLKVFENKYGIKVEVLAVGSGQAFSLAKRQDVDILIVHSPEDEKIFIKEGWGIKRIPILRNDFVLVGPKEDLAKVKGKDIKTAFKIIAEKKVNFVSRSDFSGTHKKELYLWKTVGINPEKEKWYIKSGAGMGASLILAGEMNAYILTDRATFNTIAYKKLPLEILVEKDKLLENVYSIILLNPEKIPHVKKLEREIKTFIDFFKSQDFIDIVKSKFSSVFEIIK